MRSKKVWFFLFVLVGFTTFFGKAFADTILNNEVVVEVGGVLNTYDLEEVKYELDENNNTKICICRMLCFRALQMLRSQFTDSIIPRDDIRIVTSWTTDGPEELFVEVMGWSTENLSFMQDAKDASSLTIEDAVFYFIQKSTNKIWKVVAHDGLYPVKFFTYRKLIKTEQSTTEESNFFKTVIRPQAIANLSAIPLVDKFDIEIIPLLGDDNVLRIPAAFILEGEYSVELRSTESGLFELIQLTPSSEE